MPGYFPRHTIEQRAIERKAVRKLTVSLLEMAILTGVVVRLVRALAFAIGSGNVFIFAVLIAFCWALLLGMVAAHLSNFTLRRWVWRAPLFALVEWGAEMCVSAVLITVGWEPLGTQRAQLQDFPAMLTSTLVWRGLAIVGFSLFLAGVVTLVRRVMLGRARDREARASLQDDLYRA